MGERRGGRRTLQADPMSSRIIWTKGFSGRQFSQTEGKSVVSQPERLRSCFIWGGILDRVWCIRVCVSCAGVSWRGVDKVDIPGVRIRSNVGCST